MSTEANSSSPMQTLVMPFMACLTLGLAPFLPEPHIFGKVRWVLGGAHGMAGMDWFDLVLHGSPYVWLLASLVRVGVARLQR